MLKYNFTLFNSYVLTVSKKPCLFLNSLFDNEKQYKICILPMIKKKEYKNDSHIFTKFSYRKWVCYSPVFNGTIYNSPYITARRAYEKLGCHRKTVRHVEKWTGTAESRYSPIVFEFSLIYGRTVCYFSHGSR